MNAEKEYCKRLWEKVRRLPNVRYCSHALQPRIKKGKVVKGTKCFRVYVIRKVPKAQLKADEIVPRILNDVETDVVAIGIVTAPPPHENPVIITEKQLTGEEKDPTLRYRPVLSGISGMHYKGSACTTGKFAIRNGNPLLLVNCHCGAEEGYAQIGDSYLQPSPEPYDGGKLPDDRIGSLIDFIRLEFNCDWRNLFSMIFPFLKKDKTNRVDVSAILLEKNYKNEILNIGKVHGKRDPQVGDITQKCGRTTGLTTDAPVIDVDWAGYVQYSRGTAWFEDCALIAKEGFSAGGDSSSAIVTQKDKPEFLGLLFAGSSSHTIFCKTSNIESELKVEII